LPPPDPTQPTASSTYAAQVAVNDTLPIIEEIVSLKEKAEYETIKGETDNRRKRLNAAGPEEIRREVGREVYTSSQARLNLCCGCV